MQTARDKVTGPVPVESETNKGFVAFLSVSAENLCSVLVVVRPDRASVQHCRNKTGRTEENKGIPRLDETLAYEC